MSDDLFSSGEPSGPQETGAPAWMATFADMSTLLLTFFVLLLSFANMDIVKFRDMLGSVQDAFGYQKVAHGNNAPEVLTTQEVVTTASPSAAQAVERAAELDELHEVLEKEIEEIVDKQKLGDQVEIEASIRGVVIRVKDRMMFAPGSARLNPASYPFLDEIIRLIDRLDFRVLIEGHTDNTPIRSRRFPSNWELSTSRAIAVLKYFESAGAVDVKKLGSAGYADTRPIATNDTAAGRAHNRRVEFICHRDVEDLGRPVE